MTMTTALTTCPARPIGTTATMTRGAATAWSAARTATTNATAPAPCAEHTASMTAYQPDPAAVVARGLAVFTLAPPGAKRAGPGWQCLCTSDPAVLARTWPHGANIGVGCRASGIVGIDLD